MITQPNFEAVKREFYCRFAINQSISQKLDIAILRETIHTGKLHSHYQRKQEVAVEINEWLNRLDIRSAGSLIDALIADGATLPSWMMNKKYIIDYNKFDVLDLTKI
jgi:hypothetical protein